MLTKKSRYRYAKAFKPLTDGTQVFSGIRAREIGAASGVIEHEVQAGQRLDQLARHYYNDDRLWWRIVDANPQFLLGLDMMGGDLEGRVILIPTVKE